MAYTPSPYKKVYSITVTSQGNGYSSTPSVSITGGGGTAAQATAVVVDGKVTQILVTNSGYGYTSTPSVAIDPPLVGDPATAVAAIDLIDNEYSNFKESIGHLVAYQVPEFVRNQYPVFVTFLQKYYEFLDQDNQAHNVLLNADGFIDINRTPELFVPMFVKQYAQYFPKNSSLDQRTLVKFIKDFYEAKGSEKAIELLFRVLFNTTVEFYYPSLDILRASDGIWIKNISFKLTVDSQVTYDPFDLIGKSIKIYYYENQGLVVSMKTVQTEVLSVVKNAYTFPPIYEVTTTLEDASAIKIPGAGAAATASISGGQVTDITMIAGGNGYYAAPTVVFTSTTGSGAEGRAILNSAGEVIDIIITEPGSGYVDPPAVTFDIDPIRTHIHLSGDVTHVNGTINGSITHTTYGYIVRTLSQVSVGSVISGSPNYGFDVGQIYNIDESGAEGSYVVEDPNPLNNYFLNKNRETDSLITPYVAVGRDNRARIKITAVDNDGLPTNIQILDSGYDFERETFTTSIISPSGSEVELQFTTGGFSSEQGKFKDSRGMLSNVCRLQDNYYYQDYSYVIRSSVPSNTWLDVVKKTAHPTGVQLFGELIISQQVDFSPYIEVPISPVQFYEFFEETVVSSDTGFNAVVFTISKVLTDTVSTPTDAKIVSFSKVLTDTVSTPTDAKRVSFGKNVTDSSTSSDAINSVSFTKVLTDSVTITETLVKGQNPAPVLETTTSTDTAVTAFGKVLSDSITSPTDDETISFGKNVSDSISAPTDAINNFVFGKVLSDASTSTETITSVVFGKVLSDSSTSSESAVVSVGKVLSDSTSTTTDDDIISFGKNVSDSVTSSEADVISVGKVVTDSATASENDVININKVLSETISAPTDAGNINIQNYFLEIYTSESYTGTDYAI